jgi:anthranilate phosphoribosyltransferase
MDEVTLTGPTRVGEIQDSEVSLYTVEPEDFGLTRCELVELQGGNAAQNAAIVQAVLAGEKGPHRDIVLLNSAFALVAAGVASDLPAGLARAAEAIDGGGVRKKLDGLVRLTNE